MFYNPFVGNSRTQFMQPQQQQNNFSGWNDRLTKIEEGIASLTDQFKNFQNPGNEPFKQVTEPSIRQPGDMGKYVADNDPVTPGNPPALGGTPPQQGPFDLAKMEKNPYNTEFIGIGADQTNLFGYKVPDEVIAEQEERMKNNPINIYNMTPPSELELLKPITEGVSQDVFGNPNILGAGFTPYTRNENLDLTDRSGIMSEYNKYIQGGMGSRAHTTDMRGGYSFMGEDMAPGSSTGFGDFRKFLDTYGIGNRLQLDTGSLGTAQPLQQMEGIQGLAAYQSQQNTGPGI